MCVSLNDISEEPSPEIATVLSFCKGMDEPEMTGSEHGMNSSRLEGSMHEPLKEIFEEPGPGNGVISLSCCKDIVAEMEGLEHGNDSSTFENNLGVLMKDFLDEVCPETGVISLLNCRDTEAKSEITRSEHGKDSYRFKVIIHTRNRITTKLLTGHKFVWFNTSDIRAKIIKNEVKFLRYQDKDGPRLFFFLEDFGMGEVNLYFSLYTHDPTNLYYDRIESAIQAIYGNNLHGLLPKFEEFLFRNTDSLITMPNSLSLWHIGDSEKLQNFTLRYSMSKFLKNADHNSQTFTQELPFLKKWIEIYFILLKLSCIFDQKYAEYLSKLLPNNYIQHHHNSQQLWPRVTVMCVSFSAGKTLYSSYDMFYHINPFTYCMGEAAQQHCNFDISGHHFSCYNNCCEHNSSCKHLSVCSLCRKRIGEIFKFTAVLLLNDSSTSTRLSYLYPLTRMKKGRRSELSLGQQFESQCELHVTSLAFQNRVIFGALVNIFCDLAEMSAVLMNQHACYGLFWLLCLTHLLVYLIIRTLQCSNYFRKNKPSLIYSKTKVNEMQLFFIFILISSIQMKDSLHTGQGEKKCKSFSKDITNLLKVMKNCKKENMKNILYEIINYTSPHIYQEFAVYPVSRHGNDAMSNELLRLGTLHSYPNDNCPSLIRVAEAGFYFEGKGNQLVCFSCGRTHSDWSYTSVPLQIHQRISPECPYLKERFPLFCSTSAVSGSNSSNIRTDFIPTPSSDNIPREVIPTPVSENTPLFLSVVDSNLTRIYTDSNNSSNIPLLISSSSTPFTVKSNSESGFYGSSLNSNFVPPTGGSLVTSSNRDSGFSSGYGGSYTSSNQSRSSSYSSGYSSSDQSRLSSHSSGYSSDLSRSSSQRSNQSQLPVLTEEQGQSLTANLSLAANNLPKEKYPEYKPKEKRIKSFKTWPSSVSFLHPLDLADCGFFYSNFGDCVRCYQCGIGLRNWESDDNPWVEHARWSRKCPYLIQKKGQKFIDSVLTMLGLQTDAEVEMQVATGDRDELGKRSASSLVVDPLDHPSAKYVINEKIFGDNKDRLVKKTMNHLLQHHDWENITNDMLVNAIFEYKDQETKTDQTNHSETTANSSESKSSTSGYVTASTGESKSGQENLTSQDPEKIQKENEDLRDLYTCKICLDEKVGITFVPCGHLVTCRNCSPKIRRCPLCRTFIRGTIKTTI